MSTPLFPAAAQLEVDPTCAIFPMMDDAEYAALRDDIAEHGLREPLWVYRGKLIDGRNRLKACMELGIEPITREWDGEGSLVALVVGLNLHRRHLTASQRAMVGVHVERQFAIEAKGRQRAGAIAGGKRSGEARGGKVVARLPQPSRRDPRSREHAAEIVKSSPRYIQQAKRIAEADPDLGVKVLAGEVTLPQARREVERARSRAEFAAKAASAPAVSADWSVVHGDCRDALPTVAAGSVRLVVADPPYGLDVDYGPGFDDDPTESEYLALARSWLSAIVPVLTEDASVWLVLPFERDWRLIAICVDELGLTFKQRITWHEKFGVCCSRKFARCSRALLWFTRHAERFVFNAQDPRVREVSVRQAIGDSRAHPGGKVCTDVWEFPRLAGTHAERVPDVPTQIPLGLVERIVAATSDPGDLVLDPFCGSGTSGVAAARLGRRFVGVERNPEYIEIARTRIRAAIAGVALPDDAAGS